MRIHINRLSASEDASMLKAHGTQANRKQAREKGERKRQMKKANIFVNFCFSEVGERKKRGKKVNARDEFVTLTWISSWLDPPRQRRQKFFCYGGRNPSAASWACVGFSLEEERAMQHRISKYFPQFENQGINPVGESRSSPKYLHKHKRACTQHYKGVVNPFKIDCKVRSEGGKCNEVKL